MTMRILLIMAALTVAAPAHAVDDVRDPKKAGAPPTAKAEDKGAGFACNERARTAGAVCSCLSIRSASPGPCKLMTSSADGAFWIARVGDDLAYALYLLARNDQGWATVHEVIR